MDEGQQDRKRLLIGDLVLDVGLRRVSRGDVPLDLPKLSFRLLYALVSAAPDVLTQDQLIERVWPGRVVSPETVTQRVKLVRQSLGDDAHEPRYIGLVRGQGYRLLAEVRPLEDVERHPARWLVETALNRHVLIAASLYVVAAWGLTRAFTAFVAVTPALPPWSAGLFASALIALFPALLVLIYRQSAAASGVPALRSLGSARSPASAAAAVLLAALTAGLYALVYPVARPAANSVAVMIFENHSDDPDDEYLSEGVSYELRKMLERHPGLDVQARPSSAALAKLSLEPTEVAARLGVGRLIYGTVQRSGELLRITVEIIDGASGVQKWTDAYEFSAPRKLLALQQQIYTDVAAQLVPTSDDALLASMLPTDNESAFWLWLNAEKPYQAVLDDPVVDEQRLREAIELFRQAADADPSSAFFQSRLGAALLYAGELDAAQAPIKRALDLDENLSEVQHTFGMYLYARREDGVGEHLRRAVELGPGNVEARSDYALYLWAQGDVPGARANLEAALDGDRGSLGRYEALGNFYGVGGFTDEALAVAKDVVARFDDAQADLVVARIRELTGDLDEAIGWCLTALTRDPAYEPAKWMVAELYARLDDLESARRYDPEPSLATLYFSRDYDALNELADQRIFEDDSPITIFAQARALTATGRYEGAARLLEQHGLAEHIRRDSHTTSDVEAAINLADAWNQSGRTEEARLLARDLIGRFERYREGHAASWHPDQNLACAYAIVGEDEQALQALERLTTRRGMAWFPIVKDQPCFRITFAGNPRYEAVLAKLQERKRQLRARLPETLERFGVPLTPTPSLFTVKTTTPR